jgi:signal transduction histidine kinase
MVAFFVEDRGPGIPVEVRGRVFDPFFSTKREGSGLGLTMCQRVIQRHGGKLDLRPRSGGGTRALFLVPTGVQEAVEVVS